jgi:hypothetical protein
MQPHHGTSHIKKPRVQPVPIPQVYSCHANATPAIVAQVILADGLAPEIANIRRTVIFTEADVDQEIAVFLVGLKLRSGLSRSPLLNRGSQQARRVPAIKAAGYVGFRIQ